MTWPQALCVLGIFGFAGWVLYVMGRDDDDAALLDEVTGLREQVDRMQLVVDAAFKFAASPDSDVESVDRLLDAVYEFEEVSRGDG